MKIIKRGEDPTLKPVRAHCTRCKTEVEFMPSEAKLERVSDQRDGADYSYYILKCPVCPATITSYIQR